MLKGISPLLGSDVLHALDAMGHGDDLILADMNFPADAIARQTTIGRLLTISNVSAAEAAKAVLSVFPLDLFVEDRAGFMESAPKTMLPVHRDVQRAIRAAKEPAKMTGIERFAFYERAKKAYAVILTGEGRGYANFAFRKGVIAAKR